MRRIGRLGLVLVACLFAPAQAADDAPKIVREIRVRVACDEEWRAQPDWAEVARKRVAQASAVFEKRFGIRWTVADVTMWRSDDAAESLDDLHAFLAADVQRADADVVLGFTHQSHAEGALASYRYCGLAGYYGPAALVGWSESEHSQMVTLVHELGHVLGAWHSVDHSSVMYPNARVPRFDEFDAQSAAAIELARDLAFADVGGFLDTTRRGRIAELFKAGHLPGDLLPSAAYDMRRASELWRRSEYEKSRSVYREALEEHEGCAGVGDLGVLWCLSRLAWAEMHGRGRDLAAAARLAERAMTFDASSELRSRPLPVPSLLMADVLWEQRRFEDALARYAAAAASLTARLGVSDPDTVRARKRLRTCRLATFERTGRPLWTERTWKERPLLPLPSSSDRFEAPARANLHVRRTPIGFAQQPVDAMSESFAVAAPVAGELTLTLRELGAGGDDIRSVTARIPAATAAECSALAEIRHVRQRTRGTQLAFFSSLLVIRPSGGAEVAFQPLVCAAPGLAYVCVDRVPASGDAGFFRLPFGTSLVRSRQWAGADEEPRFVVESGTGMTADGVRFSDDGAGALHTWRIELTFVPEETK